MESPLQLCVKSTCQNLAKSGILIRQGCRRHQPVPSEHGRLRAPHGLKAKALPLADDCRHLEVPASLPTGRGQASVVAPEVLRAQSAGATVAIGLESPHGHESSAHRGLVPPCSSRARILRAHRAVVGLLCARSCEATATAARSYSWLARRL